MKNLSSSKKSEKLNVFVMKGDVLVERGEFWTGGAGLSIGIEDEDLWNQVNGAVHFLYAERDNGATSANLECGWEVAILPQATRKTA